MAGLVDKAAISFKLVATPRIRAELAEMSQWEDEIAKAAQHQRPHQVRQPRRLLDGAVLKLQAAVAVDEPRQRPEVERNQCEAAAVEQQREPQGVARHTTARYARQ